MVSFAAQELVISLERICLVLLLFLLLWKLTKENMGTLYTLLLYIREGFAYVLF